MHRGHEKGYRSSHLSCHLALASSPGLSCSKHIYGRSGSGAPDLKHRASSYWGLYVESRAIEETDVYTVDGGGGRKKNYGP